MRLTNRQTVQFHGVPKENLRAALSACDRVALDSIAACGDVNRNVLCPPDFLSPAHEGVFACARAISDKLLPATGAYREIWLGRERVDDPDGEVDPLYGRRYLPRKFKIALAIPPRNDVDIFANDLGFIAIVKNGALAGFNVAVGGGLGTTFGDARTYARLASVIGFCRPRDAPEVAWHVAALQRDYGDRTDRKVARLKYTIDRLGLDVVKRDLAARLATIGVRLQARRSFAFDRGGDDLGWATDANGLRHVALWIEGGRIQGARKRGLREVAGLGACDFRVTPLQNLILGKIAPADEARVRATLARNGIDPDGDKATPIRQHAMACVALPTCPLAMAEAERYLPDFIGKSRRKRRGAAWRKLESRCASAAVPTVARARNWPKSRSSANRRGATTCYWAATRAARGWRGWSAKIWTKPPCCARWRRFSMPTRRAAITDNRSAIFRRPLSSAVRVTRAAIDNPQHGERD